MQCKVIIMIKFLIFLIFMLLSFLSFVKKPDYIPDDLIDQASVIQETLSTLINKNQPINDGSEYEVYEDGNSLIIVVPEDQVLEISDDE